MNKINYKTIYILSYLIIVVSLLLFLSYVFNSAKSMDVNNISTNNFQSKHAEREKYFSSFFNNYKNALNALVNDSSVNKYLENSTNKKQIEELFLTFKKALPSATQIRLLDINGMEIIKVTTIPKVYTSVEPYLGIVKDEDLQNKANRYYFKKFLTLKKGEIGLSKIDLEREYNKEVVPNIISLRLATAIFDKNNKKKAILIINVSLEKFFSLLGKTTLYNVFIVDNKNRFILHSNENRGITSQSFDSYTLEKEFGKIMADEIIKQDEYYAKNFYSKKIDSFNTSQDLKLILKLKFENLIKEKKDNEFTIFAFLILLAIVFLPIIIYFANVPELLKNKINKQNITDELTGLPNRLHLFNDLNKSLYKDSFIVLLNIDNHTKIQNAYGYKISDKLLQEISTFLYNNKLENDYIKIYRISKNQFALKYLHLENKHLNKSLDKLHYKIEHKPFKLIDDFETLINVTIGVSNPNKIQNSIDELKEAEIALDTAIENKSDINIYNDSYIDNLEMNKKNIQMINNIKKAIESDSVVVYFQPIFNNNTNKIEKYETLIRLKVNDTLIFPDSFIPIAKDIKKYRKLTEIIITKAFDYFKDKDMEFSINLSIDDILDEKLREFLYEKIKEYKVQNKLVIEIVESEAIDNYENFLKFMKDLKELDCKIAIDDFGSGYSNYAHIINLSEYIDYLKIDGSLINNIDTNPKAHLLVGTIKFLCDQLNIQTIAEYIENKEIFDYVQSMGISYSQGYYIGKPESEILKNED